MAFNFKLSISKRYSRHAFLAKLSEMMICHYPRPGPGKSPTSSRFFGMWSSMSAFLALVSRAARAQCTTAHAYIFDPEWLNKPHEHNSISSLSDLHLHRFYLEYLTKTHAGSARRIPSMSIRARCQQHERETRRCIEVSVSCWKFVKCKIMSRLLLISIPLLY